MPRTRDYTADGIRRVPCSHCGERKSDHQWTLSACAAGNAKWKFALCHECDVELNATMLRFFNAPGADEMIERYKDAA